MMNGIDIKQARWAANMSQKEFAEKAGVQREFVIDAEKNRPVSEKTMFLISKLLKEMSENV